MKLKLVLGESFYILMMYIIFYNSLIFLGVHNFYCRRLL